LGTGVIPFPVVAWARRNDCPSVTTSGTQSRKQGLVDPPRGSKITPKNEPLCSFGSGAAHPRAHISVSHTGYPKPHHSRDSLTSLIGHIADVEVE
jgi:hypothetical protein